MGNDDIIIPGIVNLSFNIKLSSTDPHRMLVSNIGRAIMKTLVIKFDGNEILGIYDFNVFANYQVQWKRGSKK